MRFVDEATIDVKSGSGGCGCVGFRREKFIPFGGPDGGNGGKGGDVILVANSDTVTLSDLRYRRFFSAKDGQPGSGAHCAGKSGDDVYIKIPLGTQIFEDQVLIYDLKKNEEEFCIAIGGHGGRGNASFKSSRNNAPRQFTSGALGESKTLVLQLKLLADVGIIGMPNAGKSTFLSVCSSAKPKIAHYPFTTLYPNLGIIDLNYDKIVISDIPGLIEGAHTGHGLGHRFLKHIERCSIILHMIDSTSYDVVNQYKIIRNELLQYSQLLTQKPEIIVLNKIDAMTQNAILEKQLILQQASDAEILTISCHSRAGVQELISNLHAKIKEISNPSDQNIE